MAESTWREECGSLLSDSAASKSDPSLVKGKLISLHVKLISGKTITVQLGYSSTIKTLKDEVCDKEGIAPKHQILVYNGIRLEDEVTITDCGLTDQFVLLLGCPIFVKCPNGDFIKLEIFHFNSIRDLKTSIQDKEGTPIDFQRLMIDGCDLDDSLTVPDCEMAAGMTIELLHLKEELCLKYTETTDGKTFVQDPLSIEPIGQIVQSFESRATFRQLKEDGLLSEYSGTIYLSHFQRFKCNIKLNVNVLGIPTILYVQPSDTVGSIKRIIQDETNIPIEQQHLYLSGSSEELLDGCTIGDHNITDQASIMLVCSENKPEGDIVISQQNERPLSVVLSPSGALLSLKVKSTDTVGTLKGKIKSQKYYQWYKYHLRVFHGRTELLDECSLTEYLEKECTLQVLFHFKGKRLVFVTGPGLSPGGTLVCQFDPQDKVRLMKAFVKSREGLPVPLQEVSFGGEQLVNDQTLSDCGIFSECEVVLVLRKFEIFIELPPSIEGMEGNPLKLSVSYNERVDLIKTRIQEIFSILPARQCLIFADAILNDFSTIGESSIQEGSVLSLVLRQLVPSGIFVFIDTGIRELLVLEIDLKFTAGDIKVMIEEREGIRTSYHKLNLHRSHGYHFIEVMELSDSCPLSSYKDIKEGSKLFLVSTSRKKIHVRTDLGQLAILDIDPLETVESLKKAIEHKKGVPIDHQSSLSFLGQKLEDNHTLFCYNIDHGSVLKLSIGSQARIKTSDGRSFSLGVYPTDSIRRVKEGIQYQEDVPVVYQRIFLRGRELNDRETLSSCHFDGSSTLSLVCNFTIHVFFALGKVLCYEVTPFKTVERIKQLVHNDLKLVPASRQVLSYEGRQLQDKQTLSFYGIKQDSLLYLDIVPVEGGGEEFDSECEKCSSFFCLDCEGCNRDSTIKDIFGSEHTWNIDSFAEEQILESSELGVKLVVPPLAVPERQGSIDARVKIVRPHMKLPSNVESVSYFYEITSEGFSKTLQLYLQHNAYLPSCDTKYLSFVTFDGSSFEFCDKDQQFFDAGSSFGVIKISCFSTHVFGIVWKIIDFVCPVKLYALTPFYKMTEPNRRWEFKVVITQNLEPFFEKMVAMNRGWIRKDPLSFRFDPSVNSVTLCIFDDFFDVQPLVKPFKVDKSNVDYCKTDSCALQFLHVEFKLKQFSPIPSSLELKFEGAREEDTVVIIPKNELVEHMSDSFQDSISDVLLNQEPKKRDLVSKLNPVKHQWRAIGEQLDVEHGKLKTIEYNQTFNDTNRLSEVLQHWIEANENITWKKILEVLKNPPIENNKVVNDIIKFLKHKISTEYTEKVNVINESTEVVAKALEDVGVPNELPSSSVNNNVEGDRGIIGKDNRCLILIAILVGIISVLFWLMVVFIKMIFKT